MLVLPGSGLVGKGMIQGVGGDIPSIKDLEQRFLDGVGEVRVTSVTFPKLHPSFLF